MQLVAYGKDTLTTIGSVKLEAHLPSMSHNLEFHIINKLVTPLLGLTDSLSLNLIQLHSKVHEVDTNNAFTQQYLTSTNTYFKVILAIYPLFTKCLMPTRPCNETDLHNSHTFHMHTYMYMLVPQQVQYMYCPCIVHEYYTQTTCNLHACRCLVPFDWYSK